MSKILIPGGAGFCGSNLAFHLANKHKVTVLDNLVRRGSELNISKFKDYDIEFIHGDIRNKEDLPKEKFDIVLHCAAQPAACTGYSNPEFDIQNNYIGLLNVLEKVRKDSSKMIFWSTNKVYSGEEINNISIIEKNTRFEYSSKNFLYGIPEYFPIDGGDHSIYGLSKICADLTCQEWAKAFDLNIIINRFSCLAGPGQFGKTEQGWISWFIIAALFDLPITLYGFKGKQIRDVLFVLDILNLIDIQIKNINKFKGEVFNIGGGHNVNTSLLECIKLIEKITDKKINWSYNKEQRKSDQCVYISDTSKAKKLLGWAPAISMEDGIISIVDWVKNNEEELRRLYA